MDCKKVEKNVELQELIKNASLIKRNLIKTQNSCQNKLRYKTERNKMTAIYTMFKISCNLFSSTICL